MDRFTLATAPAVLTTTANFPALSDEAAAEFGPFLSDADLAAEADYRAERDVLDMMAESYAAHLEAEAEDAHFDDLREAAEAYDGYMAGLYC